MLLFGPLAGAACSDGTGIPKAIPEAPYLRLGERWRLDGNSQLAGPVGWAVVGASGDVFVGHPLDARIAAFDSVGERRALFGGPGREPGRFRNITRAGTVGDTLWVYDGVIRRVSMFGPDLQFVRAFFWPPPYTAETLEVTRDVTVPYLHGITPEGSIVASVYRERSPPGPTDPAHAGVSSKVAPVAVPERTLLTTYPVPPDVLYGDDFVLNDLRLFPVDPLFAAASNGTAFVYIEPVVEGPEAGTYRVTRFGAAGDTVFHRRHPFYPVEIPEEVVEASIERAIRRLGARGQDSREAIDAFRDNVRVSPLYPPVLGVVAGRDGSTWIRMRPLVAGNSEYHVLDASGDFVGQLSAPGDLEVMDAELTRVWSVMTDTLGVESLVLYSVSGYSTDGS